MIKFKKIISILISCFFIYLCLKDIPLKNLFENLKFNSLSLFFAIFFLYIINFLKAHRLQILLKNYKKKKFNHYLRPIMLRQFLNTVFVGNIGEVVTPVYLKKYFRCSYFEGLSIIISERIIDLTVITFIFGVALLFNELNLNTHIFFAYFCIYILLIFFFLFIVNFKKKIFLIPRKVISNFILGYKYSIKNIKIFYTSVILSFVIWSFFILIDYLIFWSFEVTNPITSLPNIIFITGVMVLSQLIPAAPASVGIFNYFVIETIEAFYNAQNILYDINIKTQITSISIIVLLVFILPHITWGSYVFYKEALSNFKYLKNYSKRYIK